MDEIVKLEPPALPMYDPRVDKLLTALTDGALDDPGISYQEYRSHN